MKNLTYFLIAFTIITFIIGGCKKDEDGDTTKPFIELLGYDPVYTPVGLPYVDAGAIAWDVTMEGDTVDITDRMVTTGNVNVNLAGDYEVIYNVTDESGNVADERKRNVKVVIGK